MGLFYFCLVLDSICHTNNKHIVKGVLYMDKKSYEYKAIHFVLQPAMADYVQQKATAHGLSKNAYVRMLIAQSMANDKDYLESNK